MLRKKKKWAGARTVPCPQSASRRSWPSRELDRWVWTHLARLERRSSHLVIAFAVAFSLREAETEAWGQQRCGALSLSLSSFSFLHSFFLPPFSFLFSSSPSLFSSLSSLPLSLPIPLFMPLKQDIETHHGEQQQRSVGISRCNVRRVYHRPEILRRHWILDTGYLQLLLSSTFSSCLHLRHTSA